MKSSPIFGGSATESYLQLSSEERRAIVKLQFFGADGEATSPPCSGTFVGRGEVLTAAHCVGDSAVSARVDYMDSADEPKSATSVRWRRAARQDAVVIELPAEALPITPEPLALWEWTADDVVGASVLLAGYGVTDDNHFGKLRFAVEQVTAFDGELLLISGFGKSGACSSDSGGPALWWNGIGPAVVGIVQGGERNCHGIDGLTPANGLSALVLSAESPVSRPCSADVSRCYESQTISLVRSCDGGVRVGERCSGGCGWDDAASSFRCQPTNDRCPDVPPNGSCDGDVLVRCVAGRAVRTPCDACRTCGIDPVSGEAACVFEF